MARLLIGRCYFDSQSAPIMSQSGNEKRAGQLQKEVQSDATSIGGNNVRIRT